MKLPCLSVRQPWAWAIMHAGKDVENRSWRTGYRGPLLIAASKGLGLTEYESAADFIFSLRLRQPSIPPVPHYEDLERGVLLGAVQLHDIAPPGIPVSPWHMYADDNYGWRIKSPVVFEQPRSLKGRLGLFDVELTDAERAQLMQRGVS